MGHVYVHYVEQNSGLKHRENIIDALRNLLSDKDFRDLQGTVSEMYVLNGKINKKNG